MRQRFSALSIVGSVILAGLGVHCDWSAPASGVDGDSTLGAGEDEWSAVPVRPPRPQTKAEEERCVASCVGSRSLSPTDRETCRLSCSSEEALETSRTTAAIIRCAACRDRCDTRIRDAADRATCRLACPAGVGATLDLVLDERRCFVGCLDAYGACLDAGARAGSPDDRATARRQCEANAERCLDACPIAG